MMALPPLYRQQSDDSCALACLRMILAQHGVFVTESTLAKQADKQVGGVDIEDLPRVFTNHGFGAEILQLGLDSISEWIAQDIYPIVYLNRIHFERRRGLGRKAAGIVHAVIPIRISPTSVTFHDPLRGTRRRVSKRKFEAAQQDLRNWCVLCRPQ